jgi:Mrp family chromosome partitioning ATPase
MPAAPATAAQILRRRRGVFEALQLICAKLQFSQAPVSGPAIVITSAQETEGKSTVAANLSIALAAAGREVVCVGADLYRPTLHEYFDLPSDAPGLIDVMNRRAQLSDVFQTVSLNGPAAGVVATPAVISTPWRDERSSVPASPRGRLRAITAGRVEPGAIRLLDERRIADLVEGLRESADYVIFDSPPVLLVGDAYPLLVAADSVIVVARSGRTTQGTAEAVRATLESLQVERVGVILTDSRERVDSGYAAGPYGGLELASRREKRGAR